MQIIFTFKFTSSPFFTDRAALQEFSVKPFFCIPSAEFLFRHGVVFFSKLSFRAVSDQALKNTAWYCHRLSADQFQGWPIPRSYYDLITAVYSRLKGSATVSAFHPIKPQREAYDLSVGYTYPYTLTNGDRYTIKQGYLTSALLLCYSTHFNKWGNL